MLPDMAFPSARDDDGDGPLRGRRQESRLRVRLPARLVSHARTQPAILCDLSLTGARLHAAEPPRTGLEVLVEWDRFDAFGEVVWSASGVCGVHFFDPIASSVLIATRGLDDAAHLPRDRELLRQVARQWVEGSTRL